MFNNFSDFILLQFNYDKEIKKNIKEKWQVLS